MLNDIIKVVDDKYVVRVPYTTALEFARYFINHGIPINYVCRGNGGSDYREIVFDPNDEHANAIMAWLVSWYEDHGYCPFCGSLGEVYTHDDISHIRCIECGSMTIGVMNYPEDSYVWEFWDKRVK